MFLAEELVKLGIADGVRGKTWKLDRLTCEIVG